MPAGCKDARLEARADALAAAAAYTGRPLKILCLHGGGGSADEFEREIAHLKHACGRLAHFVCKDAPHPAGARQRLWHGDADKQGAHAVGFWDDAVTALNETVRSEGPFDGVMGYSMGAAAAFALIAQMPEGTFRFAVGCCGYPPTNQPSAMRALEARRPLHTPFLCALGRNDGTIPNAFSMEQVEYFAPGAVTLLTHPGGHTPPHAQEEVAQLVSFLLQFGS